MQRFTFGGWASLKHKYFLPVSVDSRINWDSKVTDSDHIAIYLKPKKSTNEAKNYHKIYYSDNGFDLGSVLVLIVKTYQSSIHELHEGDQDYYENLDLDGFNFDHKTNSVFSMTSS